MNNIKLVIAGISISLLFIGCGGGSSLLGEEDINTETSPINIGTFVDSPVEGLKYETDTLAGYTDNQGRFQYRMGENIKFKIGNLELGNGMGKKLMTPMTLTNENDLNKISKKATNIARILQSLDENLSNKGLIKIPAILKNLDVSNIDLEVEADLVAILAKAQDITSKQYILKSPIDAKTHMKKYIKLYNKYDIISAGYYSYSGKKWYILTMPTSGNIIFGGSGSIVINMRSIGTIYDTDLNSMGTIGSKSWLEAGTYILQVYYDSSGNDILSINSPILYDQDNLPALNSGRFSGKGFVWYKLNMPKDGNIVFEATGMVINYNSIGTIYDTDLNSMGTIESISWLEAGKYILRVHYDIDGGDTLKISLPENARSMN